MNVGSNRNGHVNIGSELIGKKGEEGEDLGEQVKNYTAV